MSVNLIVVLGFTCWYSQVIMTDTHPIVEGAERRGSSPKVEHAIPPLQAKYAVSLGPAGPSLNELKAMYAGGRGLASQLTSSGAIRWTKSSSAYSNSAGKTARPAGQPERVMRKCRSHHSDVGSTIKSLLCVAEEG